MVDPLLNLPDKQNGSEGEINKKMSPYMDPIYRLPPKPPNMKNREEKERKIWDYRPPSKPPYIQNADGEMIGILEKGSLPYVGPEYRPPPKPPRIQDNPEERIWPLPNLLIFKIPMKKRNGITDPLLNLLQKLLMWPGYQR